MPVILALSRQRQGDHEFGLHREFKASFSYKASKKTKPKTRVAGSCGVFKFKYIQ
jgi:hypothetical protein